MIEDRGRGRYDLLEHGPWLGALSVVDQENIPSQNSTFAGNRGFVQAPILKTLPVRILSLAASDSRFRRSSKLKRG